MPTLGAEVVQLELRHQRVRPAPALSTIERILRRHGYPKRRPRRSKGGGEPYPARRARRPGDLQQTDLMGPRHLRGPAGSPASIRCIPWLWSAGASQPCSGATRPPSCCASTLCTRGTSLGLLGSRRWITRWRRPAGADTPIASRRSCACICSSVSHLLFIPPGEPGATPTSRASTISAEERVLRHPCPDPRALRRTSQAFLRYYHFAKSHRALQVGGDGTRYPGPWLARHHPPPLSPTPTAASGCRWPAAECRSSAASIPRALSRSTASAASLPVTRRPLRHGHHLHAPLDARGQGGRPSLQAVPFPDSRTPRRRHRPTSPRTVLMSSVLDVMKVASLGKVLDVMKQPPKVRREPRRATGRLLPRISIKNRLNLHCFFDRITDWGYPNTPQRPLVFAGDLPIVDKPLPRFLDDAAAAKLLRTSWANADPPARVIVELLAPHRGAFERAPGAARYWCSRIPLGLVERPRSTPSSRSDPPAGSASPLASSATTGTFPSTLSSRSSSTMRSAAMGRWRSRKSRSERRPVRRWCLIRATALRWFGADAGIGHVTAHQLRHTLATQPSTAG